MLPIDEVSTAFNIIWFLAIRKNNLEKRRYFEQKEIIQMVSQDGDKKAKPWFQIAVSISEMRPKKSFAARN